MRKIRDAVEILDRRYGGDPEWDRMVIEEELNARVAQLVYALRNEAGLTQAELAKRIGTRQPVLSKLENADYEGSALEMLWRICVALDKKLEVTCRDRRSRRKCPARIKA
ncbi:MAG: helix-turn-helix transcriptional regulator [Armatimonadetes bacterium]|nr:helix-turn-helix transcriptional regulator [Armatimonadota bacterium]